MHAVHNTQSRNHNIPTHAFLPQQISQSFHFPEGILPQGTVNRIQFSRGLQEYGEPQQGPQTSLQHFPRAPDAHGQMIQSLQLRHKVHNDHHAYSDYRVFVSLWTPRGVMSSCSISPVEMQGQWHASYLDLHRMSSHPSPHTHELSHKSRKRKRHEHTDTLKTKKWKYRVMHDDDARCLGNFDTNAPGSPPPRLIESFQHTAAYSGAFPAGLGADINENAEDDAYDDVANAPAFVEERHAALIPNLDSLYDDERQTRDATQEASLSSLASLLPTQYSPNDSSTHTNQTNTTMAKEPANMPPQSPPHIFPPHVFPHIYHHHHHHHFHYIPQMSNVLPATGATGGMPLDVHGFPHVAPQFAHHTTPTQALYQQLHHDQFVPQHFHNPIGPANHHHHYSHHHNTTNGSGKTSNVTHIVANAHYQRATTTLRRTPSPEIHDCSQDEDCNSVFPPQMAQLWIHVGQFLTEREWLTNFVFISKKHLHLVQRSMPFALDLAKYDALYTREATPLLQKALRTYRVRSIRLDSEDQIALTYKHKHKLASELTSIKVAVRSNLPSGELLAFFTREAAVEKIHFHSFMCSHTTLHQLMNRIHDRSRIKQLVLDFVLNEIDASLRLVGFKNLVYLKSTIPIDDFDELPELQVLEGKLNCCPEKLQQQTPKLHEINLVMNLEQFPRYETIAPYLRPKIKSIQTDAHEERFFLLLHNCKHLKYLTNSRPAFLATVSHTSMYTSRMQFPNIIRATVTLFELGDVLKVMYCFPKIENWEPVHVPLPNCRVLMLGDVVKQLKEKLLGLDSEFYNKYHESVLLQQCSLVEGIVEPYANQCPVRQLPADVKERLRNELKMHTSFVLPTIVLHCLGGQGQGQGLDLSGLV